MGKSSSAKNSPKSSKKSASQSDATTSEHSPLVRLFLAFGKGLKAVWSAFLQVDDQLKRDGFGIFLIALAVIVALREWFGISGTAGGYIHLLAAGAVGIFSVVIPLGFVALAVTLFQARSANAIPHRVAGALGISVALTALAHVSAGNPALTIL